MIKKKCSWKTEGGRKQPVGAKMRETHFSWLRTHIQKERSRMAEIKAANETETLSGSSNI